MAKNHTVFHLWYRERSLEEKFQSFLLLFQKVPKKILSSSFPLPPCSFCSPLRLRRQQLVATLVKRDCGARNGSCFARSQPRHHLDGSLLLHIFQFSLLSTLPPFLPKVLSFSLSLLDRIAVTLPSFLPMHSNGCTGASFIALYYYRCKRDVDFRYTSGC